MNCKLKYTLRAWPAITAATIGLCLATQAAAKLVGIDLPDQQNVEVVRQWMLHAFDSPKSFATCAMLLAQVLALLPAVEEFAFRWLLVMLPHRAAAGRIPLLALAIPSSALFSAAHYVAQPFPDSAFVALFFFGLAQCWLYGKTDRIWFPMLNHLLFNLTNIVLLFVVPA